MGGGGATTDCCLVGRRLRLLISLSVPPLTATVSRTDRAAHCTDDGGEERQSGKDSNGVKRTI